MGILIDSCHPKLKRPKTRGRAGAGKKDRTKGSSGAFDFRPQGRQGGNMGYQERLGAGQGEVNFAYAAPYLGCCLQSGMGKRHLVGELCLH